MRRSSMFDLASVSKAVATTTSVMLLVERSKIDLNSPINAYLTDFASDPEWKKSITVRHLLTHTSGLPAWSDLYTRNKGRVAILNEVLKKIDPVAKPGTTFVYSDIGFILLGQLVEEISGKRLDSFARMEIFRPLGMNDTSYNPKGKDFVSTEYSNWRREFVHGSVHDENAYSMGGVSGHAGLFSTAVDLSKFCDKLLAEEGGILSSSTVKMMTSDHTSQLGGYVGLGWWIKNEFTPNIGSGLPERSFGHNGYTGTSVWIDPESKLVIILLTNRIHPVREGDPAKDRSVGIMMNRKNSWSSENCAFQDAVSVALESYAI